MDSSTLEVPALGFRSLWDVLIPGDRQSAGQNHNPCDKRPRSAARLLQRLTRSSLHASPVHCASVWGGRFGERSGTTSRRPDGKSRIARGARDTAMCHSRSKESPRFGRMLCLGRLPVRATPPRRNKDAGSAWRALYGRRGRGFSTVSTPQVGSE
jgi:hypothetical protein